jgi:hypothetical protein
VPEKERKLNVHHDDYKEMHEEDYEKQGMGYHADYSPIDESRR